MYGNLRSRVLLLMFGQTTSNNHSLILVTIENSENKNSPHEFAVGFAAFRIVQIKRFQSKMLSRETRFQSKMLSRETRFQSNDAGFNIRYKRPLNKIQHLSTTSLIRTQSNTNGVYSTKTDLTLWSSNGCLDL